MTSLRFSITKDTNKSDLQSIRDDLSERLRIDESVECRVPTGSFSNPLGITVSIPPCQIARLLQHLSLNKYGRYVHIGKPSNLFALINEYVDPKKAAGTVFCLQPLTRTLLEYNRHTFFRSSQVSYTHETFMKRLSDILHPGDLVSLDIGNEDVGGIIGVCDFVLQRGCEIVLFNIADPDHPNISKLWRASCANQLIWHNEYLETDKDVLVTSGGIGVMRLK